MAGRGRGVMDDRTIDVLVFSGDRQKNFQALMLAMDVAKPAGQPMDKNSDGHLPTNTWTTGLATEDHDGRSSSISGLPLLRSAHTHPTVKPLQSEVLSGVTSGVASESKLPSNLFRSSLRKALPRHLRRRTTSHKKRTRKPKHKHSNSTSEDSKDTTKTRGERRRRRLEGRLASHMWTSKRMNMEWRWGYRLGITRLDQGIRAGYFGWKHGCCVHDLSYYRCLQVRGRKQDILAVLRKTTTTSKTTVEALIENRAGYEWSLYLQHVATGTTPTPSDAPSDDFKARGRMICPAHVSWNPSSRRGGSAGRGGSRESGGSGRGSGIGSAGNDSNDGNGGRERSESLNIWIHPAAAQEATEALLSAIEQISDEPSHQASSQEPEASHHPTLSLVSLRLARFELRGPTTCSLLSKLLVKKGWIPPHTLKKNSNQRYQLRPYPYPSHHHTNPSEHTCTQPPVRESPQSQPQAQAQAKPEPQPHTRPVEVAWGREIAADTIVDTGKQMDQCEDRGRERKSSGEHAVGDGHLKLNQSGNLKTAARGQAQAQTKAQVPLLIVYGKPKPYRAVISMSKPEAKNDSSTNSCVGESLIDAVDVIAPMSAAGSLWVDLIYSKARALAIQQRVCLFADAGVATFPRDFPDSHQGQLYWELYFQDLQESRARRPKGKRPAIVWAREMGVKVKAILTNRIQQPLVRVLISMHGRGRAGEAGGVVMFSSQCGKTRDARAVIISMPQVKQQENHIPNTSNTNIHQPKPEGNQHQNSKPKS
ncbi:hypothetical protein AAMO2058_001430600 [Amorphochlora amoebiformis]